MNTFPTIKELCLNVEMAKCYWELYKKKGCNEKTKNSDEFKELSKILNNALELAKQISEE